MNMFSDLTSISNTLFVSNLFDEVELFEKCVLCSRKFLVGNNRAIILIIEQRNLIQLLIC